MAIPAYQTGDAVNEPDAPLSRPQQNPCKRVDPARPLDKRHAISGGADAHWDLRTPGDEIASGRGDVLGADPDLVD